MKRYTSELERHVERAARRGGVRGGVLIVIDSDDDCPADLAPRVLARIQTARNDLPSAVVLAQREFEAWFLAAAESLQGRRGLPQDLASPANPESIRGAKEWLTAKMPHGRTYSETADQPAFAQLLDLTHARRAKSFDKMYREIA